MEQRITPEMLAELSDEQKERLRKWWKPQQGDWVYNGHCEALLHTDADTGWIMWGGYFYISKADSWDDAIPEIKTACLPLLSIGQCMELLRDKAPWQLGELLGDIIMPDIVVDKNGKELELIVALWQAVKAAL